MNLFAQGIGWSLLILGVAWVFSDPDRNSGEKHFRPWSDPVPDVAEPLPAIDPMAWQFDYEKIEKELLHLDCDSAGLKQVSDNVEGVLRRAVERFPQQPDENVLQRIEFLAGKNCPPNETVNLPDLLMQYYHYTEALKSLHEQQFQHASELSSKEKFAQTETLRIQHFGEANASKLFGRQQVFANYLFERQRIMRDEGLTEVQKKAALDKLKKSFKESGEEPAGAG
ncbi:lipase chaperone [Ketobacter sp. MCCC 1A13808]|uniref:lipase secretion chaperone n=1 Tax=Ketobacter sp. MCCC 1A13808 TaxID=2602738 RepID=UPI0012EC66C0|nr:lipase secretion chaperone [Ketobacter sp. MCCC 1A13808]MVF13066.1 lipase chaperone [Ketobacter sp. MCCC 1A13808]